MLLLAFGSWDADSNLETDYEIQEGRPEDAL